MLKGTLTGFFHLVGSKIRNSNSSITGPTFLTTRLSAAPDSQTVIVKMVAPHPRQQETCYDLRAVSLSVGVVTVKLATVRICAVITDRL